MLKEVIENIDSILIGSKMFEASYGLCELIEKEGLKFPAKYCINKYEQVSDFENKRGTIYHRLRSNISVSQEEDETEGCAVSSEKTYPMIMIGVVKKDLFKNKKNDAFIELSIIENIEALISTQNNEELAEDISAERVSIIVKSSSYDRYSIFKKEYTKIEMKIPFEYAVISIEYDVIISQKLSCYNPVVCS